MGRRRHVVSDVACTLTLTTDFLLILLHSMGGAETTSGMMAWWMLAMLAYPESQARAQAELDAVVGRARLPTFADYSHLPYIRAIVKEILRWRTVAPLGLPHRCTEDNWYEGMFIPKGAICIANVWHMNHDPKVYGENAVHFDPARHLDASGDIVHGPPNTKEEGHVSYGFGRRQCVGLHVADNSLFINIAVMLWATKIERKKDASGQLLPLDVDGFVDHGIVVLAASLYMPQSMLTWTSADARSPSSATSRRASRKLLPCLQRNVNYVSYEHEDT